MRNKKRNELVTLMCTYEGLDERSYKNVQGLRFTEISSVDEHEALTHVLKHE